MTSKFLITAAAATVVSTMALAQMGQPGQPGQAGQPRPDQSTPSAQPGQPGGMGQPGQMGQTGQVGQQQQLTDREFVRQVASSNQFEIKSAKLVQDKVDDDQVKQHAKRIEQDHKRAHDELKVIADNKDIDISEDMDVRHQRLYDQLKDQDDQQLAQTWKQQQQQAHQEVIRLLQQASTQLQDPELRQWAQKQLPIVQQHQAMLRGDPSARPAGAQLGQDQIGQDQPGLQDQQDQTKDKEKDTGYQPMQPMTP